MQEGDIVEYRDDLGTFRGRIIETDNGQLKVLLGQTIMTAKESDLEVVKPKSSANKQIV